MSSNFWMSFRQGGLTHLQRFRMMCFCLRVFALQTVEFSHVVQCSRCVGMSMDQHFTPDGQHLLIEFFCSGIVPKRFRECCKVMQALSYGRMHLTQNFPAHCQCLCIQISACS